MMSVMSSYLLSSPHRPRYDRVSVREEYLKLLMDNWSTKSLCAYSNLNMTMISKAVEEESWHISHYPQIYW